ncbi:MAG TPA: response regulator transcription factor [Candidatus Limnocylindrales bacterium]|nr:response regulator transcription factor [Candidatus Limnocylindrales bacterium]
MKVLVAESDPDLLDLLSYALRREGFVVATAGDGQQALSRWESDQPEFVVLAADLPKRDGLEICRSIRRTSMVPLILYAEGQDRQSVIAGLDAGADDFLREPFHVAELLARIRAVLRRKLGDLRPAAASELRVGDIFLDLESHQARRRAVSSQLTHLEFRILHLLMMNAGRTLPFARLIQYAWGYDDVDTRVLKTHLSHIRRKLGLPADGADAIRSVSRVGYSLVVASSFGDGFAEGDQRRSQSQVSLRLLSSNPTSEGTAIV